MVTEKKYELTQESKDFFGVKLYRIRALISFGVVVKGDLGGYVETEKNVSHSGNAWVSGNAQVSGNAWVSGDAQVSGDAWVYGDAQVSGNARVSGNAQVYGNARVKIPSDYFTVSPIGSRDSSITFTKSNMSVATGCYFGTIDEFTKQVKKTHGSNQHATNYLALVKLVKQMWKGVK